MRVRVAGFLGLRALRGKAGSGRYLRGAVLAVGLSLVPLLLVMEVSTGMIEGITARLLEVGTAHLEVVPPATDDPALLRAALAATEVPGVLHAVAERQGTVLLASSAASTGVLLRCVDPLSFAGDEGLHRYLSLEQGSAELGRPGVVLLSAALASTLEVSVGGQVLALTTPTGELSGFPRLARLTVGGVYSTGYQEIDRLVAYGSLADAARLLPARATRALIDLKVADPFGDLTRVEEGLRARLGPDARVASWRQLEASRLASFDTIRALLLFIMALIVLVAAANVSSAVLTLVLERRSEIAMLASLGAHPRTLTLAFLVAGLGMGLLGTAIGLALGLLVAVNINEAIALLEKIVNLGAALFSLARSALDPSAPAMPHLTLLPAAYYLQRIPIRISAAEVAAAGVGTLLASGLAAWLPAARAGRLAPLEVLRRS